VRAVQELDGLAMTRADHADLLPPQALEARPEATQRAHDLDVLEALRKLRKPANRRVLEAWAEENVGVLPVTLVEALEELKQMLTHAGEGLLQEEGVYADSQGCLSRASPRTSDQTQVIRGLPVLVRVVRVDQRLPESHEPLSAAQARGGQMAPIRQRVQQ